MAPGAPGPLFAVLDIVQIVDHPIMARQGLPGLRGTVISVRRYAAGHYRYDLGSAVDADIDDPVPGIYDEDYLRATGERGEAEWFGPPPPFRQRDVVRISDQCEDVELRGQFGVITSTHWPDEVSQRLGLWIEALEEDADVYVDDLTRTGERRPAPALDVTAHSTQVSTDGHVLGQATYVVVDDIEQYL